MASNVSGTIGVVQATGQERIHSISDSASVPWYIWVGVVALTSSSIGGAWDVSWHRSIGRDTFWTPAHMAIYLGGILVGIVGLWLMLSATFGSSQKAREVRAVSVRVLSRLLPLPPGHHSRMHVVSTAGAFAPGGFGNPVT